MNAYARPRSTDTLAMSNHDSYIHLLTGVQELFVELLPTHLRLLSSSIAINQNYGFIGKKALKSALLERLPLTEFERIGFGKVYILKVMNDMLKGGWANELIVEAKERRDRATSELVTGTPTDVAGSNIFLTPPTVGFERAVDRADERPLPSPKTPTRVTGGGGGWSDLAPAGPAGADLSEHVNYPSYNKAIGSELARSRSHQRLMLAEDPGYVSGWQPSNSPSDRLMHVATAGAAQTAQSPMRPPTGAAIPLPFLLRYQLLLYLQRALECACYTFLQTCIPDVFKRKPQFSTCPQAAELTEWNRLVVQALTQLGWSSQEDGMGNGELFSAIKITDHIRHDAVHRNIVEADKLMSYIQAAIKVVSVFGEWASEENAAEKLAFHLHAFNILQNSLQMVVNAPATTHTQEAVVEKFSVQLRELNLHYQDTIYATIADISPVIPDGAVPTQNFGEGQPTAMNGLGLDMGNPESRNYNIKASSHTGAVTGPISEDWVVPTRYRGEIAYMPSADIYRQRGGPFDFETDADEGIRMSYQ